MLTHSGSIEKYKELFGQVHDLVSDYMTYLPEKALEVRDIPRIGGGILEKLTAIPSNVETGRNI